MKNYQRLSFNFLILLSLCLAPLGVQAQTTEEQMLEGKIKKQLEAVLGEGKAHISVSGQSTIPSQSREKVYSQPQVLHERIRTEKDSSGRESTQRSTQWINNQSETLTQHPVKLKQKSVSVVYDPPKATEDNPNPLSDQQIEELVTAAANLDVESGDQLHVQAGSFSDSAYERLKAEMEKAQQGVPWWIFALIALVSLGLGIGITYLILRKRYQAQAIQIDAYPMPAVYSQTISNSSPQG